MSKEPGQLPRWDACSRYWQMEERVFDRETSQGQGINQQSFRQQHGLMGQNGIWKGPQAKTFCVRILLQHTRPLYFAKKATVQERLKVERYHIRYQSTRTLVPAKTESKDMRNSNPRSSLLKYWQDQKGRRERRVNGVQGQPSHSLGETQKNQSYMLTARPKKGLSYSG